MAKAKKMKPRLDATGRKRLLKLADLLEKDAKNRKGIQFDMGTWGVTKKDPKDPVSCGTQACAMGLAALSGAFESAGLTGELVPDSAWGPSRKRFHVEFRFDGQVVEGEEAAAELFGMSVVDASALFGDWPKDIKKGAVAEKKMAARLRNYVNGEVVQISDEQILIGDTYYKLADPDDFVQHDGKVYKPDGY